MALTYKMILEFDKARSKRLEIDCNAIKTHSRRRSLPTILANTKGTKEVVIRALGRWTLAILAFYITISHEEIVRHQKIGLEKAQQITRDTNSTFPTTI